MPNTSFPSLLLDNDVRSSLWNTVLSAIESYLQGVEHLPVSPSLNVESIRRIAESFTFAGPLEAEAAFRLIASELLKGQAWISTIQLGEQKRPGTSRLHH